MSKTNEITTIQLSKDLRDLLKALGKKGETYEQIIRKLLSENKTKD